MESLIYFFSVLVESFSYDPNNGVLVLVKKQQVWESAAGPLLVIFTKCMAGGSQYSEF